MSGNNEKSNLRKILLERRNSLSYDFIKIASKQIHGKLKQVEVFAKASNIGAYFPIGNEVRTQDIMQEILGNGKKLCLPRVIGESLSFRQISGFEDLEKSSFSVMEPKEECPVLDEIDVVLVPTVGITRNGVRLGYGHGYYDRFLSNTNTNTISLIFSKQIVKSIPFMENDIKVDWIVTEDEYFQTSNVR